MSIPVTNGTKRGGGYAITDCIPEGVIDTPGSTQCTAMNLFPLSIPDFRKLEIDSIYTPPSIDNFLPCR